MTTIATRHRIVTVVAILTSSWTLLLATGCNTQRRSNLRDAVVGSTDATKAYRVVERTRTYLPYEYSADGCYARASYMQMELFAAKIPSRVVFIRTRFDAVSQNWEYRAPRLAPNHWAYHVAPVIRVDGLEMVLDPGLAPNSIGGALTLQEWLATMKALKFVEAPEAAVHEKVSESVDRFVLSRAANPDAGPVHSENVRGEVIHSASEMPTFSASMFFYNFKIMDYYLIKSQSQGRLSEDEMIVRRALLATRTVELAEILETKNQITGPGGDLEGIKITLESLKPIQSKNEQEFQQELIQSLPQVR